MAAPLETTGTMPTYYFSCPGGSPDNFQLMRLIKSLNAYGDVDRRVHQSTLIITLRAKPRHDLKAMSKFRHHDLELDQCAKDKNLLMHSTIGKLFGEAGIQTARVTTSNGLVSVPLEEYEQLQQQCSFLTTKIQQMKEYEVGQKGAVVVMNENRVQLQAENKRYKEENVDLRAQVEALQHQLQEATMSSSPPSPAKQP